jgi:integrase
MRRNSKEHTCHIASRNTPDWRGSLKEFTSIRYAVRGATWLVQRDVPLYSVQKLLGHASPITTQIYSHLSEAGLAQAIQRMDFPQVVPA